MASQAKSSHFPGVNIFNYSLIKKPYEIIYGIKISHGNITERIYWDLFYDFVSTLDYTYMVGDDWEGVWNDSDVIQSRKTTEIPVKVGDVKPAAYRIEV